MKIVNAVWEERNLGISSAEITAEISDQVDDFEKLIIEIEQKYKYITVKVPTQRTDLTWLMGKMSYVFVEDMMFFEHDLHQITRTPLQQRLYDSVKVEPMSESDFPILFEEIDKGSFSFDRISNDPYFSKKLGTKRFHNWLYDEKERNADRSRKLWLLGANCDPVRDGRVREHLILDAMAKRNGPASGRNWPEPVSQDPALTTRLNERLKD